MTSCTTNPPASVGRTSAFPGARRALLLLLLINLFNYIDRNVLAAVVDPIRKSFFENGSSTGSESLAAVQHWCYRYLGFKADLALMGLLSTAFMVTYMAGAPIFGRLAERRSRWMLVGIGVLLWSLASGASGLAATFFVLLATRCFVGIGEAAYGPVAPTLISDFYPVKSRGRVLACFYVAIPVGTALGYAFGDTVATSSIRSLGVRLLGIDADSWRWAFYLVVPPGLLLGAWSLFMRDPPRGQTDLAQCAAPAKIPWRDYGVLLHTPSYVLCTLGMTAMNFAMGGFAFWMPHYLKYEVQIPGKPIVIFGTILCTAGLLATLLGGTVGDRLRRRFSGSYFLVSGIGMLLGFPFVVLTMDSTSHWIWLWIFITCFCLFFNTGPTNAILANVTHPSIRAAGFALNIFIIHAFGDVISPVVIGILSDRYNMSTAFSVIGAMFVLAGVFWLVGMRYLARDTALAPTRLGVDEQAQTAAAMQ